MSVDTATIRALWEQTSVDLLSSHDVPALCDEVDRLRAWTDEAVIALQAATTIGERSCRDGDHLNYGNHDRLIREAAQWSAYAKPRSATEQPNQKG